MITLLLVLTSLVLVAACGMFVAAEFSLLAVNRNTVEKQASKGNHSAKGILQALHNLSTQLSGAQLGITIASLAIGFLAQPAIAELIKQPLLNMGVPASANGEIALALAIAIATAVTMVFGELVPKNLAIAEPLATARFVQRFQRGFTHFMKLPIASLNYSANWVLSWFGVQTQEELASARSADELVSLARRSAEHGTLSKETAAMIERSLNFGELTALDVMTPRLRMRTISRDDTAAQVIALAEKSGLSRFPVIGDDNDNVVGIVHIKQAIALPHNRRPETPVTNIMRDPVFVPSGIQLEPLLGQLRSGGMQMAVVVDEFGGVDGIVTIEDLLEELVGEVHDEHDRMKSAIKKRSKHSWNLSGLLRPDEIGEELGIFLPEHEEYETIGGLIAFELAKIPKVNDIAHVAAVDREGNDLTAVLGVDKMDGLRVDRIIMHIEGAGTADGDAS